MKENHSASRRDFMALSGAALAAGTLIPNQLSANENAKQQTTDSLFSSPVILQNPTENSITAAWTLSNFATGWIEWGTAPDKLDQKACGAKYGLKPYSNRVIQVTINGLKPNTTYFYRAAASAVDFRGAYDIRPAGETEFTKVLSFTTPGPNANSASFAVVNDTHHVQDVMALEFAKIRELKPDYTFWNGDSVNSVEGHEMLLKNVIFPANCEVANDHPLLFVRGNHDTRGHWARYYPEYFTPWKQDDPEFDDLGYSFVVRHGDLAMIGLDTGEDKPDFRKEWGGLAEFEPYIAKQGEWLKKVLNSEKVKTAKFVVAFCHIPLFDPRPGANPGTLETGHSAWKKLGADFWGPALQEAGVQLVVAAHVHRHRIDEPTPERCWTQITGGGCSMKDATVIHGAIVDGKLKVTTYFAATGEVLSERTFEPRA